MKNISDVVRDELAQDELLSQQIEEAIDLLRSNGYFVKEYTKVMEEDEVANNCVETGCGDCMECSCFVCMNGCE